MQQDKKLGGNTPGPSGRFQKLVVPRYAMRYPFPMRHVFAPPAPIVLSPV